ncbi:MAG: sugar ABC transporter ATP-binding protein [Sebaldella sp.]|nr:sugar ABC transporter ATP-binding protein [Sebaldella sp.]
MKYILEMKGITKRFSGVTALSNVDLKLKKGEVHTLLGENGAGKSTLMKILSGVYHPNDGEIFLKGEKVEIKNPKESQSLGISIIYQELSLCPNMSISENIFANREPMSKFFVNYKEMSRRSKEILEYLDVKLNPATMVQDLSISERQMIEIAKAVAFKADIIIMDEPTSSLSMKESDKLFEIIEKLKKDGVSIIYISHRMDELLKISDNITVMRDGQYIATVPKNEASVDSLIKLMVGREMKDVYPKRESEIGNEKILEVKGLEKEGYFKDINFSLRKGEIIGFFGLVGSGRSDVAKSIFGVASLDKGEIYIRDKKVNIKSPEDAIKNKIAFVTENRREEGVVLDHEVRVNVTMATIKNVIGKIKLIDNKKEVQITKSEIKILNIKTSSTEQLVGNLSGGNQQKVIFAKWLETKPDILILDEPTRGIDVGAKSEIYEIMRKLASEGVGIIMISSELSEVLFMSDKLFIMREKSIVKELNPKQTNQEEVMLYSTGGVN